VVDDCIFTGKSYSEIKKRFQEDTVLLLPLTLDIQSLKYYKRETRNAQEICETAKNAVLWAEELGNKLPAFQGFWDWCNVSGVDISESDAEFAQIAGGGDLLLKTLWFRYREEIEKQASKNCPSGNMINIYGPSLNPGIAMGKIFYYSKEKNISIFTEIKEPSIVVAMALTPKETIQFGKLNVVALVVRYASSNSHVSILARTMNLPALMSIEGMSYWHNKTAIVDAYNNLLILEPDEKTCLIYLKKKEEYDENKRLLMSSYKAMKAQTKSGKNVHIYANINAVADIDKAIANGAEGIGVFKTEFIFLDSPQLPTEEEQFQIYWSMATKMGGRKFVIRTLDVGVDKTPDYFHLEKEENPALGYRAIRMCLDKPDVFIAQIRAILRASAFGNVSIMYPMIISVEEIVKIKEIVKQAMDELRKERIPYNENIEQGIMIETPASVFISEELAQIVDFFSIGTNDLTQYMLAIDRLNPKLESINNPYHPAVFRAIKFVVENAHKAKIWVSISGELGADVTLAETFIEYGVDALTVSPEKILQLKETICNTD
jgi:phosphotransferase system enzyme I (PtsI)